jgi:hypothetical protein
MNDTATLLLATTILSIGGVGLYMYKSDEGQQGGNEYNEDSLFGSGSFWSSSNDSEEPVEEPVEEQVEDEEDLSFYEPKVKARGSTKTKRNRKSTGTKRRY